MPCHTDREKESTCRVTMPLWHSEAEHLPYPDCWPPAEAQIISLQGLHVLVGTGQALRGSTHDVFPTFPFVKRCGALRPYTFPCQSVLHAAV